MRRLLRLLTRSAVFAIVTLIVAVAALILSMRLTAVQRHLGEIITALAQRPGHFFVRVGNVRGALPWNLQVDRVEIGDADGVWMVIEDAEADWHPFDLWKPFDHTHLCINVDRIHARRLLWTRLPIKDDEPDDEPFRWDKFPRIIAGDLVVDEFDVGEGLLAGGHAVVRAHGNGILGEWERGRLDLTLERIDGKRGQARIDLYSDGSPPRFHGSVVADEEAGGALAFLARLPEAGPVRLRVESSGPLGDWSVGADVDAGAIGKLDAQAHIAFGPSGAFRIEGTFDPVARQRDRYLVGPGDPLALLLDGAWIPDHELRLDQARLNADGRVLEVRGRLDLAAAARSYELAATLSREVAAGDNQRRETQLGPVRFATAKLEAHGVLGATDEEKPARVGAARATVAATLDVEEFAAGEIAFEKLRGVLDSEQREDQGPLAFNLDVRGERFAVAGAQVPLLGSAPWLNGRGQATVGDGVVSFERIEVGGDAVHVDGTANVDDDWRGVRVSLTARSEDLAGLSTWIGGGIAGGASVGLQFDSKDGGDALEATLDGKAFDLSFGDPGLQALVGSQLAVSATASGKLRGPVKAKGSVAADGIRVDADGELQADGHTVAATFTTALDNLARLSDRAAASVAGRVEASGEVRGTLEDFSLRSELRGSQLAYDGFRFDALAADVSASGLPDHSDVQVSASANYGELRSQLTAHATMPDPGTLLLRDVVVQGPKTTAGADLRIGLEDGSIFGSVKIASEDLSRWRAFFGHGIGGGLTADLAITPATQAQPGRGRLSGTVSLRDGSIVLPSGEAIVVKSLAATANALAVDGSVAGEAYADIGGARVLGITVDKARVDVRADGGRWLASTSSAGSGATAWTLALRTTLLPKTGERAGVQARTDPAGVTANVELLDLTLGSDAVHLQQPTSVVWTPDSVTVGATAIGLGESGKLQFSGQLGPGAVRAEAALEDAPLSLVAFLVPDLGLRGRVTGSASLRGPSVAATIGDVHLEGHDLASRSLEDTGVTELDALADGHWERDRLRGEASVGGLGQERFNLKIDAPIGAGARDGDAVSASLLWHGDLADLAALAPLGEDVLKGRVSADLRLGGSVAAPLLSGDLSVSGGSYENAVTGLVLHELDLKIAAQGSNLILERLSATDGENGRVTAAGRAGFARLPAFDADMELHASAATLARLDLVTATADADLALHLGRAVDAESVEGALTGKVKIQEARIRVPDRVAAAVPELAVVEINDVAGVGARRRESSVTATPWNVVLDVAVKGNNRVYVEGRGLESEWSTDLQVGGTIVDPRVTGLVRSVRGTLGLLGKRFDVTNAELRFDGAAGSIPYLTLTAKSEANDITAIVVANGPATTPTIELRSDPALPSDDILARLLFGRGATSLTPMQSVQVARSLAELTGLSLTGGPGLIDKLGRSLGRTLRLDSLGVEAGSGANAGSALTASKYLTDKVYLRVQQGLTPQDSKISVEWEVYKRLRVESDISQDAQGEVGATWQWDY